LCQGFFVFLRVLVRMRRLFFVHILWVLVGAVGDVGNDGTEDAFLHTGFYLVARF
jgi:hypothetical protein